MLSSSSSRPRFQVDITMKIARPITIGNHPPCMNLSEHETTSTVSSARNTPVAPKASQSG
jgi:hypothetical protein